MKIHERTFIVAEAKHKIGSAILNIQREHNLTTCELLTIMTEEMQSILKYALRAERHPNNPTEGADIADYPKI